MPSERYDPAYKPNPGSKLTLIDRPGEGVLEAYLPGTRRNGHHRIAVRLGNDVLHTDTSRIRMIVWKAPAPREAANRPPRSKPGQGAKPNDRAAMSVATSVAEAWSEVDPPAQGESVLSLWSADREDENGDLPMDTMGYPGVRLMQQLAVWETLGVDVLSRLRAGKRVTGRPPALPEVLRRSPPPPWSL